MSKYLIYKGQEYVRVDEEPKAPKTITHNGEKYARCDTIEEDVDFCKRNIDKTIQEVYGVEKSTPVKVMIRKGNEAGFVIENIEYKPNLKTGDFELFGALKLKRKVSQLFSYCGGVCTDCKITAKGKTSSGNEIYKIGYYCKFKNHKPK